MTKFSQRMLQVFQQQGLVLEDVLGAGGMGAVFRARDLTRNNEVVAVKTLLKSEDEQHVERLRREVMALRKIDHPNVVKTYRAGMTLPFEGAANGAPYIVMEHVAGCDLETFVKERMKKQGYGLSDEEVLHVFGGLSDALVVCHENLVFHRDLKPSNIIIINRRANQSDTAHEDSTVVKSVKDLQAKIIDFGLVKFEVSDDHTDRESLVRSLTQADNGRLGTPGFMAPERLIGGFDDEGRADVFGLAASMYFCLSGNYVYGVVSTLTELMVAANAFAVSTHLQLPPESKIDWLEFFGRALGEADERPTMEELSILIDHGLKPLTVTRRILRSKIAIASIVIFVVLLLATTFAVLDYLKPRITLEPQQTKQGDKAVFRLSIDNDSPRSAYYLGWKRQDGLSGAERVDRQSWSVAIPAKQGKNTFQFELLDSSKSPIGKKPEPLSIDFDSILPIVTANLKSKNSVSKPEFNLLVKSSEAGCKLSLKLNGKAIEAKFQAKACQLKLALRPGPNELAITVVDAGHNEVRQKYQITRNECYAVDPKGKTQDSRYSGVFKDLQSALDQAAENSTVILLGSPEIEAPVYISRPVTIEGQRNKGQIVKVAKSALIISSACAIKNLDFKSLAVGGNAIQVSCHGVRIHNCKMSGFDNGIEVVSTRTSNNDKDEFPSTIEIIDWQFDNIGLHGISASSHKLTVKNCTFTKNEIAAVSIKDQCQLTIENASFDKSEIGLSIRNCVNTVNAKQINIGNSGTYGIFAKNSALKVHEATLTRNGKGKRRAQIYSVKATLQLLDLEVTDSKATAMIILGGTVTIEKSTFRGGSNYALIVEENGKAKLSGCRLENFAAGLSPEKSEAHITYQD